MAAGRGGVVAADEAWPRGGPAQASDRNDPGGWGFWLVVVGGTSGWMMMMGWVGFGWGGSTTWVGLVFSFVATQAQLGRAAVCGH
jgi:hypothetical protein